MGRETQKMLLKSTQASRRLTPRQIQLLRIIARVQASHCYSPTIGELAGELGISRSTTFEHIGELRGKGLLSAQPGRARSLKLTSKGHRLLSGLAEGPSASADGIPLVGTVAAGLPMEAIEDRDCLSLASCFGAGDDVFALEVRGDSMVGEDIREVGGGYRGQ
ncbi:MAG: LexA family protein [Planctomycetota bacterium]